MESSLHFISNAETKEYFAELPKSYFLNGARILEKALEKCIELEGDFVEKQKAFFYLFLRIYWTTLVLKIKKMQQAAPSKPNNQQ